MRSVPFLLVCLLPIPAWAQGWHTDTETCRRITDALLHGQVQAAQDLFMPDNASDALRANIHQLMLRLADSAGAVTEHLPPRLERVLPDIRLGNTPVSLEIWSFGDRQVYLIGCGIRPYGDQARISIQAYPTLDDVAQHLRDELQLNPDTNINP